MLKPINLTELEQQIQDMRSDGLQALTEPLYFFPVGTALSEVDQWIQGTRNGDKVIYEGSAARIRAERVK